jgi:hypothetical protein
MMLSVYLLLMTWIQYDYSMMKKAKDMIMMWGISIKLKDIVLFLVLVDEEKRGIYYLYLWNDVCVDCLVLLQQS